MNRDHTMHTDINRRRQAPVLAVIVPCFNEQEAFPATDLQLNGLLCSMKADGEIANGSYILYVDDGSTDGTWRLIESATSGNPAVKGLRLAANSGHQNALMAGMEHAVDSCDALVTIDADLQDDPDAVREMVKCYRDGAEIVYGVRRSRDSDTWFKRNTALAYYRVLDGLGVKSVYNHADFRLMGIRAVAHLLRFGERNLYLRGVVRSLGYRQDYVYYDRRPRMAGVTKYPFRKVMNLAVDGVTSFSVRPVRMVFFLGLLFLLTALGIFIYVMVRYFGGYTIEGWTSLMLSIWFCTGVLLMALGIIGEYVGKIYTEVKHRPRYSIETSTDASDPEPSVKTTGRKADRNSNRAGSVCHDLCEERIDARF